MTWPLFRPEDVAPLVLALPEALRPAAKDVIERILANPHQPVGCTVSRVRRPAPHGRDRLVVEGGIGVFVTYEILDGIPPLMDRKMVRIIAITPLGEYHPPL